MPVDPPRDAAGNIVPHDHAEILDDHHVIRRITPNDLHRKPDSGVTRVASGAYSESTGGGMSVDIEEWMIGDGLDLLHYVTDPAHGAVRISVRELRQLGFQVGWDPDGGHPHHGAVWGIGNGSKNKRKVARIAATVRKATGED
jgi:hypothetical protein